jgi:EAL domain-containing protein (putative c-di-GMP-specific phosphodiesterase class I)
VLLEACRWATFIGVERGLPVSVNLSARQFNDPKLVQIVSRSLEETGLPAHLLTLEITESTAMQQTDVTLGTLKKLKDLGVSIALDDFGTGYSSFSYLKLFPVNTLKIDRSFVSEVEHDGDHRAIVAAIIALAQVLGLKVIAEGVETEAQKQFLRGFGCEHVQGYLTGRPVDADTAAKEYL